MLMRSSILDAYCKPLFPPSLNQKIGGVILEDLLTSTDNHQKWSFLEEPESDSLN